MDTRISINRIQETTRVCLTSVSHTHVLIISTQALGERAKMEPIWNLYRPQSAGQ